MDGNMKAAVSLLTCFLLSSCVTVKTALRAPQDTRVTQVKVVSPKPSKPRYLMTVDYSDKSAQFYVNGVLRASTGNVRMGNKVSSVPRSLGTPTGEFTMRKEPGHRYGTYTWRLSGPQGKRGILVHRKIGSKQYSRGCICPPTSFLKTVFNATPKTMDLRITR